MKTTLLVMLPAALLLSACTTHVDPVFTDNGSRSAPCIDGGPDQVAQQFYDLRTQQQIQGKPDAAQLSQYRPYLSSALYHALAQDSQSRARLAALPAADIFSSLAQGPTRAEVHSASRILNSDAKNIPLAVDISRQTGPNSKLTVQDEVLMIREGQCWVIDDVRYQGSDAAGSASAASSGTLRQVLENR